MKPITAFSLIVIFCAISLSLPAQKCYLFRHYTIKDGLPSNTIFNINQDRNGYLWVATDGGIARFDGSGFDVSVLPDINNNQTSVQYIDKLPDGRIALASFMQGTYVEQQNGTFRQYLRQKKRIGKNVVRCLKSLPDGRILTSENNSVNIIEGDTVKQIYYCGTNRDMFQTLEYDSWKNIWFGGTDGLGLFFSNGKNIDKHPFILPELKDIFVIKIVFVTKNKLFVGTESGYYEVNIQSGVKSKFKYTVSQPVPELKTEFINHIYPDRKGDIWIASANNGIFRLRNNVAIQHITMSNGLLTKGAMCVYQDNEGNYWFGTPDGLSKLENFSSFSYHFKDKPLNGVFLTSIDKLERLWLFTEDKILFIKGNCIESKNIKEIPFLKNKDIKAIDFYKDKVYFFVGDGIYALSLSDPQSWNNPQEIVRYGFGAGDFGQFLSYHFDNDILWIGSDRGMYYVYHKKINEIPYSQFKTEQAVRPNIIYKDKSGQYWFGDKAYGLYSYRVKKEIAKDGIRLTPYDVTVYKSAKADSAFLTVWIMDFMQDSKGYYWLASMYSGVYKLQKTAKGLRTVKLYSIANGLSSNEVHSVQEAPDKSIWIRSAGGVDRLVVNAQGKEYWQHFNDKNGFGRDSYCMAVDSGKAYIGYDQGFYAINYKSFGKIASQNKVLISEIRIMNRPDTEAMANPDKVLKLSYRRNYISFDFGVVTFTGNSEIEYQYFLKGLEKSWNPFTNRRYVEYSALPPGSYTFCVRCRKIGTGAVSEVTSYRFIITPPFYASWWFISILVLLVAGILFLFYRNRIRQLIQINKMRNRIASDLHDDIGSTLSSISIMSSVLQNQIDNSSNSGEIIRTIGKNAYSMLESMDDIIWSVNPTNDKFDNLSLRIREYSIPLFEAAGIKFNINTPEEIKSLSLSMDVRRNVFLICKEAVNNLTKYSGCTEAVIDFKPNHSFLTMTVSDNGKGFDTEKQTNRNGLKNMEKRAKQIGGKLSIISQSGKGTTIMLEVKLN